jgi:hypothetical protein
MVLTHMSLCLTLVALTMTTMGFLGSDRQHGWNLDCLLQGTLGDARDDWHRLIRSWLLEQIPSKDMEDPDTWGAISKNPPAKNDT